MSIQHLPCLIDLHLHLDGALSMESVKELAKLNHIDIPNDEELHNMLTVSENCRDLNEFLEKFAFPNLFLQTKDSLTMAIYNLLEENREQGIMYAEVRFAPCKSCNQGLTQKEAVEAALEGMRKSELPSNLILCCMRGVEDDVNLTTVELAYEYREKGVVALDLAGAEVLFPTTLYKNVFARAKELGVPFTIHCGEACGVESMIPAIEYGCVRIGHGIHCKDDDSVMKTIVEKNITLELCPSSNLNTASIKELDEFPIKTFMEHGVKFSINTDDPTIEGINLQNEFDILQDEFGLTLSDIKKILLDSVDASFASSKLKEEMRLKINESYK